MGQFSDRPNNNVRTPVQKVDESNLLRRQLAAES